MMPGSLALWSVQPGAQHRYQRARLVDEVRPAARVEIGQRQRHSAPLSAQRHEDRAGAHEAIARHRDGVPLRAPSTSSVSATT